MPPKDTYFTAYFNIKGELIGAEPASGKSTKAYHITDLSFDSIDDIRELSIILKPGHSPCCIKQGPHVICWC